MHKSGSASSLGPGGLDLTETFFRQIQRAAPPSPTKRHTKISVNVAIAQTILTLDVADELIHIGAKAHKPASLTHTKIQASVDYELTAGARQAEKKPDAAKNAVKKPDVAKKAVKKPDAAKNAVKKPDAAKKAVKNPDAAKNAVKKPDATKKAVKKPDAAKKAVKKPDAAKKAVKKPDAAKKAMKKPDAAKN